MSTKKGTMAKKETEVELDVERRQCDLCGTSPSDSSIVRGGWERFVYFFTPEMHPLLVLWLRKYRWPGYRLYHCRPALRTSNEFNPRKEIQPLSKGITSLHLLEGWR